MILILIYQGHPYKLYGYVVVSIFNLLIYYVYFNFIDFLEKN